MDRPNGPARLMVVLALVAAVAAAAGDPIGVLRFADADGHTIALDAPGVLYLVDFWALECKPCMVEMPELARLAKEYEPSGRVRLVSVVYGGWKGAKLRTIAEGAGSGLVAYSDPEDWIARLGIDGYPTKIMIRDGKVLRRARGGGAGAYAKWKAAIDDELRSPRVASPP